MIAGLARCDASSDFNNNTCTLVTEHGRKESFRILATQRERICVANTGRDNLDEHFARPRSFDVNIDNLEWLTGCECDSGSGLHDSPAEKDLDMRAEYTITETL